MQAESVSKANPNDMYKLAHDLNALVMRNSGGVSIETTSKRPSYAMNHIQIICDLFHSPDTYLCVRNILNISYLDRLHQFQRLS